jgi:hypothetical protein
LSTRRSKNFSIYIKNFLKKTIFFLMTTFSVIEKTKKKISTEIFFNTLIDLSLHFFQKLCVTFSFGCFQTFWTYCTVCICKLFYASLKYVIIFVCFRLIWIIHIRFHHPHDYCLKFLGLFVHLLNRNRHYHFHCVHSFFLLLKLVNSCTILSSSCGIM